MELSILIRKILNIVLLYFQLLTVIYHILESCLSIGKVSIMRAHVGSMEIALEYLRNS